MDDIDFMDTGEDTSLFSDSRLIWMLAGAVVGMGLMYIMDPRVGRRRRALIKDKVTSYGHKAVDYTSAKARDISNRVTGPIRGMMSHRDESSRGDDFLQ